jgi:hypothetical protein
MPVSPQDFALWSRMTGNPMPRTPAEQMALAPQVFQFNRQLSQGQNPVLGAAEAVSSTIDKVGKTALLGLVAGAGLLTGNYLKSRQKDAGQAKPAEAAAAAVKEEAEELPAVVEQAARGAASGDILSAIERAKRKTPAELRAGRMQAAPDLGDASEIFPKDLDLYEQHTEAMHRRSVSDRAQQFLNKVGVADAVAADDDVPASSPATEVATVVEAAPVETPDSVQFARERARGVNRPDLLAQQAATQAGNAPVSVDVSGAEPRTAGMADPRAMREILGTSTRVAIPETQPFVPTTGYPQRLMLDDEPAVDNDIVAQNPLSNTGLASQDITSADPASAIGQRISANQTGAAVAARSAAEPKQTVASKLSQQQSPVHLEEADTELVGAPAPGAAEAFRKGRQYQEMKQRYEGLQDIASPGTEGVSSGAVLPTVRRSTPVPTAQPAPGGASSAEIAELDALLARSMSTTPQAERIALRNRHLEKKYGAAPAVVTEEIEVAKPAAAAPVAFLKGKAAVQRPGRIEPGAMRGLMSQAEVYEGQLNPPKGTVQGSPAGGSTFIEHARLYPDNTMGVKLRGQDLEYVHKVDPGFLPYAAEMIKSGDFAGEDYNRMRQRGMIQPYIGSEDLPSSPAMLADFIAKERARMGL